MMSAQSKSSLATWSSALRTASLLQVGLSILLGWHDGETSAFVPSRLRLANGHRWKTNHAQTDDGEGYGYNLPSNGYSLADHLEKNSPDRVERFVTTLTPILGLTQSGSDQEFVYDQDGFPVGIMPVRRQAQSHEGVARIDTLSTLGQPGEEPTRWLVALSQEVGDVDHCSYVMINLPPYSDDLVHQIRFFMNPTYNSTLGNDNHSSKAKLDAILITNVQCLHYDTSPGVYVTRKSEMNQWKLAFPEAQIVMYRLDIPRECRGSVTQILDGYGPWGWEENRVDLDQENTTEASLFLNRKKFIETGRPLKIEEWDEETQSKVLRNGELPPDETEHVENDSDESQESDNDQVEALYSLEAIKRREECYRLLAVYTPGHTFGSVTYILPQRGICCSGYALPLESPTVTTGSNYDEFETDTIAPIIRHGPRLDYQGYLATSVSRPRQMSSALSLINNYIDRFDVVLPARGDMIVLDKDRSKRKTELMESVGLYRKIGEIYNRLGIVEQ